ncbi:efflux RND transporter periplasmic adaptor subunit [Methylobacterium sp.]|jgi:cobalt-zinc-cadmium efflux system membrane fusion protein|uniref:efflux RND transporter periplasmic adaptor subunit n=1 Tax=Methylobacterium sp. TaxID=409 RepID=UPI0025DE50FB|nr:efflux RND transporter periplasmic adaptor subunit [Methylobacterium sp.]MBY0259850.1 efflux RND transporter periplasmic adaptor subunit [Methylobacterium sp.]
MSEHASPLAPVSGFRKRTQVAILAGAALVIAGALWLPGTLAGTPAGTQAGAAPTNAANSSPAPGADFVLTPDQLAAVTVVSVEQHLFSEEINTEGKIGVDEYQATPVFSPYPGRVVSIFARTGERVKKGQRLFSLQANEMVQAQNDYLAALNVLNKARSQLALSQAAEKRLRDLYESRVTTLRELQNAQNDLTSTTNDARTAEVGLEAVRSRLRILGLRDDEVANLQKGSINPETAINAPLDGTIIQRKIGPGQYVGSGGGEPSYIIGDLSKVWLIAQLREPDAARVDLGDRIKFRVLAFPERVFDGQINFIGASVDPATRRITVRADIDNTDNLLKPEMYASVRIINERETVSPSVPRSAVVLEGPKASVWVLGAGNAVQSRRVRPGIIDGGNIEILQGLAVGERVISRGSLFIDRMLTRS